MSRRASERNAAIRAATYTPPTVKPPDHIAYRSDAEYEQFIADADPEIVRRLQAIKEKSGQRKEVWLKKLMTRADVFNAMAIWQTRFLIPLAQRLDYVEAYLEYLEKPFYERWWIRSKAWAMWAAEKTAPLRTKLPIRLRGLDDGTSDG